MFSARKPNTLVGLDIETGSLAATEVRGDGSDGIARTAIGPLSSGIVSEGEVIDPDGLSDALRSFFADNKLAKTVRLGIANQRVVVRVMRLPLIENEEELETAVRFQAQDHIPMPLDQAVLDHRVIAKQAGAEGERHMEVVAVAARRDMVHAMLGAMRKAGLRPMGIDLSAFGMIRALNEGAPEQVEGGVPEPTTLYAHLGDITNLAVARGTQCLFTRIAPFGLEDIATRVAERENMPVEQARDWLLEVGLEEPVDSFGGEQNSATATRESLEEGATKLVDELRVSLEFYGAQEGSPPIDQVVICGPGTTIPGLPERVQTGLALPIQVISPGALSDLDDEDAARLTLSYGLALDD